MKKMLIMATLGMLIACGGTTTIQEKTMEMTETTTEAWTRVCLKCQCKHSKLW